VAAAAAAAGGAPGAGAAIRLAPCGNLISSRVELSGVCDMVCLLKMLKPTAAGK